MPWYQTFDATFFLTFSGMVFGFLGVVINGFFKSKCKTCSCCGLKIERDIIAEIEEQKLDIENDVSEKPIRPMSII